MLLWNRKNSLVGLCYLKLSFKDFILGGERCNKMSCLQVDFCLLVSPSCSSFLWTPQGHMWKTSFLYCKNYKNSKVWKKWKLFFSLKKSNEKDVTNWIYWWLKFFIIFLFLFDRCFLFEALGPKLNICSIMWDRWIWQNIGKAWLLLPVGRCNKRDTKIGFFKKYFLIYLCCFRLNTIILE